MVQTAEAQAFLARIAPLPKGPGVNLDQILQPSLDDETQLRRLLATDRSNARLSNPYVGLVDVFEAPSDIRMTRARVITDDQDLNARYVMPLAEDKRRNEGEPCMVGDLDEFKRHWDIFSEGSLSQLTDWSNVIVAGGSVLACLAPLSDVDKVSKRAIRKHYHSVGYPTSDIDLFLWGLSPEQAERKIITIYEAVRDSIPWDVTCVRTKNAISIHSQYPYRSVQIVLRLYHSPAEVLAGFDIDAPCCAYDGRCVWANPRAIVAMMRQCNTIDVTRRSPSYEVRLLKYAKRGFEVYIPSLVRADVDPTIFERSIVRIEGLARLLVLERLATFNERQSFLRARRELRGRPPPPPPVRRQIKPRRNYQFDLKYLNDLEDLEMNDYDVPSLRIPYGPGWKARRTERLIYKTDLGMNTTFNPKNKGRRLHRHPAFFGTIEECMEDCCEHCPEPIDEAERELQSKEEKIYIRGRITFIQDNPGRQMITGSFNPIDVGDWSAQAYIDPTERMLVAIAARDRTAVANMIKEGVDVNRRDHVGRSTLHFAVICHAVEIACDLVDAGARMRARLVDGRTSLHLAVQYDQAAVVRKLLEKSAQNRETKGTEAEEEREENQEKDDRERLSSEDDWSSEDDGVLELDDEEQADDEGSIHSDEKEVEGERNPSKNQVEQGPHEGENPEDNPNEPDVLDLNAADWDFGLTPLAYAVIFASFPIIEDLIAAGVDVRASTQNNRLNVHPLTLTILRPDEDEACKVAERLILAGATSSPADSQFRTIFYRFVASKKVKLASTIMRCDPNANAVINFPCIDQSVITFPLVLAVHERDYSMIATLLAYGARLQPLEEDITRAISTRPAAETLYLFYHRRNNNLLTQAYRPVEIALNRHDDIIRLLVALGADVDMGIRASYVGNAGEEEKRSIFDWVNMAITAMEAQIKEEHKAKEGLKPEDFSMSTNWREHATRAVRVANFVLWSYRNMKRGQIADVERMERTKQYFEDVRELLVSIGAKTWGELQDAGISKSRSGGMVLSARNTNRPDPVAFEDCVFRVLTDSSYHSDTIPRHLFPQYHELCEASLRGDSAKIEALCLPLEGAQSDGTPLQITVMLGANYNTGVSPFSIAVKNRKWDTARLILAIAVAQYEAGNEKVVYDTVLDEDESVNGTDHSDDSDKITKGKFYADVAKRPSTIKCDVKPNLFFTATCGYRLLSIGRYYKETVFEKTIKENDLEAFVKLLNMFTDLPIAFRENIVGRMTMSLLWNDRSEMLDELIRRTGTGIDLKILRHESKDAIPVIDKNNFYLGLNINGKKRIDLARKNDPNAGPEAQESPFLWKALRANAKDIVEYLTSEKVYDAYHSYAMSHSSERAERLRRIDNIKERLPQWLGFRTNSFGESPLTAAVLSRKAEVVKNLFSKKKEMMEAALHDKYKPANLNMLQIAIRACADSGADTELLDFLLAKNISPLETDIAGRNPYHVLCYRNKRRILKHLLDKLPSDINDALLKQQTRGQLKTPLHLAVEVGAVNAVEMLLACSHVANTIRDSDGCLPIHIAVRRGLSRITKLLINASPSTLLMEDGIGSTAFESAKLNHFRQKMDHFGNGSYISRVTSSELNTADKDPERYDLDHLENELPRLRDTIDSLLKVGKLRKGTGLEKELVGFAEGMEDQIRRLQQAPVVVEPEEENLTDVQDYDATCNVVREALNNVQGQRELVHVMDVRKSVDGSLTNCCHRKEVANDDIQEEEKGKEESFVQRSIIDL